MEAEDEDVKFVQKKDSGASRPIFIRTVEKPRKHDTGKVKRMILCLNDLELADVASYLGQEVLRRQKREYAEEYRGKRAGRKEAARKAWETRKANATKRAGVLKKVVANGL
jgi:hypothetical protein